MIYTTRRFSQSQENVWKEIERKEKSLLLKYGLHPDDWFCDIWVRFGRPGKQEKYLPSDITMEAGLGIQGALDIYYSPSTGYWTSGEWAKDPRPTKVTPDELKKQILITLEEDLKSLKECGVTGGVIKFQEENIKMIKSMGFIEKTKSFTSARKAMKYTTRGIESPEYMMKLLKNPPKEFRKITTRQIKSPKYIERQKRKSSAIFQKNGVDYPKDVLEVSNQMAVETHNNTARLNNGNFRKIMKDLS